MTFGAPKPNPRTKNQRSKLDTWNTDLRKYLIVNVVAKRYENYADESSLNTPSSALPERGVSIPDR